MYLSLNATHLLLPRARSAEDDVDQVIAAIDLREAGTLGCSYYSAPEKILYLLGDIGHSNTGIIDTLVIQIKPTILLTSTRLDHFNRDGQWPKGENSARPYLPYQLDVRLFQEFNRSNAKRKLIALVILSKHEERFKFLVPHNRLVHADKLDAENLDFTSEEGRNLHMASFFDLENKVTLGCADAILTYLQRQRSSEMQVASLEMSTLDGTMFVNVRTLIMVNQGPGKGSSSQKEGLSGKQRLQQNFLRPSVQLDIIHERHAFISVSLQGDNHNPMNKMVKGLKHIKNLRPVLINLQKGISTGSGKVAGFKAAGWATLLAFAFYGIDVHDAFEETSGDMGWLYIIRQAIESMALHALEAAQLYTVGRMIQEIVDIDSFGEQGRAVLKQVAIEIATTIPASFDIDMNVIYFPQLGFKIAIPLSNTGKAAYNGVDEGWELIFITENRAYFKDFRMREMDGKLGDIYGLICEKEIGIIYDLAQRVQQYEKVLTESSDVCGEIDSLLAMTQAVTCYNLVRRKMPEDNKLRSKELILSSYVPNDTFLVDHSQHAPEPLRTGSNPSMLLLSGPNSLGKSVYMKQLALIVYLAQTEAESAEIGIVDKVPVKSNSQDSVSQIQSTFMNDLQQISFDLIHLTGRRTSENDGIGLARGIFEHLLSLEDAPRVVAATHFHEILENWFLRMSPRPQLGHMDVQVCEESREADEQITYLYNCAALDGISQAIVNRANELVTLSARGENLVAACAMLSVDEMKVLQYAGFLGLDLLDGCQGKNAKRMLETLFDEMGEMPEDISVGTLSEE
ncbi:muts domain V-domain-containing protein [Aspergillus falconensis]